MADRVPEPGRPRLTGVEQLEPGGGVDQRVGVELRVGVEVILDRALAAAGDEQHPVDPRSYELLHDVLHNRLVDERQHLLGLRARRRQQAGAEPRDRHDRVGNRIHRRDAIRRARARRRLRALLA